MSNLAPILFNNEPQDPSIVLDPQPSDDPNDPLVRPPCRSFT